MTTDVQRDALAAARAAYDAADEAGIIVVFKTFGHRIKSTLMFWKKDEPAVAEPTTPVEGADPASTTAP